MHAVAGVNVPWATHLPRGKSRRNAGAAGLRGVAALVLSLTINGCHDRTEIVVFHAASLARTFHEIAAQFSEENPGARLRVEVSGSQVAARKVAELGMRADVVAVADVRVIDELLIPEHASWTVLFTTNELVLAHRGHSRYTEEVTTENWTEIVSRPDVRLGCVDPDLAPIGYRTVILFELAAARAGSPDLVGRLQARCAPEHMMPDEAEMLALLSARAIDYAIMYRSTADEHHLKATSLPPEINLGDAARARQYARASTEVRMKGAAQRVRVAGAPIVYGLTIPKSAPNPAGAAKLVAFVIGAQGRRILTRSGFTPLVPARSARVGSLPAAFAPLVVEAP